MKKAIIYSFLMPATVSFALGPYGALMASTVNANAQDIAGTVGHVRAGADGSAVSAISATVPAAMPAVVTIPPPVPVAPAAPPSMAHQIHESEIEKKREGIMTMDDVNAVRKQALDDQAAMANPAYDPDAPPPEAHRDDVDYIMEAGRGPETIHESKWAPFPITFLDRAGKAISIKSVSFNARLFNINGNGCDVGGSNDASGQQKMEQVEQPQGGTKLLFMVACKASEWGAINVLLEGYPVPVVFMIAVSPKFTKIDVPVVLNMRVPSPPSPPPVHRPPPKPRLPARPADDGPGPSSALTAFMTGTPPAGAAPVRIGGDAQAWRYRGSLYVKATGRLQGGTADGEATRGQQTVLRFDSPVDAIHLMTPAGVDQTLTIGSGAVR